MDIAPRAGRSVSIERRASLPAEPGGVAVVAVVAVGMILNSRRQEEAMLLA